MDDKPMTIRELADRVYDDYFSVAPKYRTGDRMCELVAAALREFREMCAKECDAEASEHWGYDAASIAMKCAARIRQLGGE